MMQFWSLWDTGGIWMYLSYKLEAFEINSEYAHKNIHFGIKGQVIPEMFQG